MPIAQLGRVLETMAIHLKRGVMGVKPEVDRGSAGESTAAGRRQKEKALREAVLNAEECKATGELESAGNYYILASELAMELGLEGDALSFDTKARQCYHM